MQFERLTEARRALVATRSRNAKRDLIAEVLRDATPGDIEIVVSYLSGSLRQRRTGLGWKSLQTAPDPAREPSLTVSEVDAAFAALSELSGAGSTQARSAAANALFARATAAEQELLHGLISGELRQGALEAQVQEGLAGAFEVPVGVVRRAAMLLSSTAIPAASPSGLLECCVTVPTRPPAMQTPSRVFATYDTAAIKRTGDTAQASSFSVMVTARN